MENQEKLDPKVQEQLQAPATVDFVINVAQTLESRVDYNFNSIMSVSMLVEFLYQTLEKQGIDIPLDEEFETFQAERLAEIQEKFKEAAEKAADQVKQEAVEEAAEADISEADIDI